METIAIILYGGACFAAGMYFTTQIEKGIDKRITKKSNKSKWVKETEETKLD